MIKFHFIKENLFYILRIFQFILKFGTILFIPNYLDIDNLSYYSYINTISNIGIVFFGAEIWYYYNRKYPSISLSRYKKTLNEQYSSYISLYMLGIPILILALNSFNDTIIIKAIFFCILSHWIQEIIRSLIYIKKLTQAAIINIIQSLWIISFFIGEKHTINYTLNSMLITSITSILISRLFIPEIKLPFQYPLNKKNLIRTYFIIKKIKWYFISSLSMRLSLALPVIYYKLTSDNNNLAIFTYYYTIATGIEFFVYHFIQAKFMYPLINENKNNITSYLITKKKYFLQNSFFNIILLFSAIIFSIYILPYIVNNHIITNNISKGILIIISMSFINITNYYSIILYTQCKDLPNIITPIIAPILPVLISIFIYLSDDTTLLGYIYYIIFSISLCFLRFYFWFKYDEHKKHNCFF